MIKERNSALDLIRTLAILFVITVHSFKFLGYYNVVFIDKSLYLYTAIRWVAYTCVPLFLLLTGYLQNKKKPEKKYYKSLYRILESYICIAVCAIIFKIYYLKQPMTIANAIISIFNFNAIDYAWYVEMYIGLFLLIPFLNIIYNKLEEEKRKKGLIATFLIITALTLLIKSIKIGDFSIKTAPEYLENIYPITYYFIGAYISEYKPKINKAKRNVAFNSIYRNDFYINV